MRRRPRTGETVGRRTGRAAPMRTAASVAALACTMAPGAATAERVIVRSGEHEGFTRIVLHYTQTAGFELKDIPGGYRLDTGDEWALFDVSDMWRRIERDRVRGIAAGPDGALDLRLACDCPVRAQPLRNGMVVIDVADPEPPATPPAPPVEAEASPVLTSGLPLVIPSADLAAADSLVEAAAPVIAGEAMAWPAGDEATPAPPRPVGTRRPGSAEPAPAPVETARREPPAAEPAPRGLARVVDEAPEPADRALDDPDLEAFGADLVAQLARGIDQGVLEPAMPLPEGEPARPVGGQILIATAAGRDTAVTTDPEGSAAEASACPSEEVAAVLPTAANPEADRLEAIAAARAELYGEFDRLDPEAARRLVGAFLAAGLGAEARAIVRLALADAPGGPELDAVAALMDGEPAGPGSPGLEAWAQCDGAAALWAVLALDGRLLPRTLDRGGVVGAVSTLPPVLREHLVPRLAEAFLADRDLATARLLRNAVRRTGAEPGRAMRLLDVRLDLAAGAPPADPRLVRLAADTDDVALEAAALLLEGAGAETPEAALIDAELLVGERRGSEEGERLRGLLVAALMDAGRWDDALSLVEAAPSDDPGTPALWEGFARSLAEDAADPPFVRLVFAEGETLVAAPISAAASAAIDARRQALGFGAPPEEPEGVAAPIPAESAWWPEAADPDAPAAGTPGEAAPARLADGSPDPAGAAEPAILPLAPAPDLSGPIAESRDSLAESRQRRAALAERLARLEEQAAETDGAEPGG